MQIKYLHKNVYKLYAYSRTQECLDVYRKKYEEKVQKWQKLRLERVNVKIIEQILGFSRSTYYRMSKTLKDFDKGIAPPSKKPKKVNKPRWGEAEFQLVLRIRRENPTYGKEKIAIILKRDHGQTMSESTVGRIITHLKAKGLITKSPSALRTKRKRNFQGSPLPLFERHIFRGFYRSYARVAGKGCGWIFCGLRASIEESLERGAESMAEATT